MQRILERIICGASLPGCLDGVHGLSTRYLAAALLCLSGPSCAQSSSVVIKCDGSDVTTALNNAIAPANRRVTLTPGICRYGGGGILGEHTILAGSGPMTTMLQPLDKKSGPDKGFYLRAAGYGSGIESLGFIRSATVQTSGTNVDLSGTQSYLQNFYMDGDFNGILLRGSVARVINGRMHTGAPNGTRIRVTGGDTSQTIDNVLIGPQESLKVQNVKSGIEVYNVGALIISNTSVLGQNINLFIHSETAADQVAGVYVNNSFFDNARTNNIRISASGNGAVQRTRIANSWAGSSHTGDGVVISSAGGTINGLHFIDLQAVDNNGSGLTTSGQVQDLSIIGGSFAGNRFGIYLNGGLSRVMVSNANLGASGGFPGNSIAGVVISKGVSGIIVSNNFLSGNKGQAIVDSSGAGQKSITGNVIN